MQDAINAFIRNRFNLNRHVVRSQKAYVRLPLDCEALFTLLLEKGPNKSNRLEPVADRHVDIHENEPVRSARFSKPVLYKLEGLLAISRTMNLKSVLLQEIDDRNFAKKAILNDENLCFGVVLLRELIAMLHLN